MGAIGPISYREVMYYADELELGLNNREFLWDVIKKVDGKFLSFMNEKMESSRRQAQAAAKPRSPAGG